MLALILAIGMLPKACPMTIGIGADGAFYSDRFAGWYTTSARTLESDLHTGCYNDANPSPVTSVRLAIASGAQRPRVEMVFSILKKEGWPKAKVITVTWSNSPQKPR